MIHEINMENVTSARYSLLHIDEAMNNIISLIILNNFTYNNHHMYLSRLHYIISTDARNTSAQRVGHDRTDLCEHAPSIQHVNNSELRENATYKSNLYFTHHKTLKCNLEL